MRVLFLYFSEFLNLSWMKPDKNVRAPNILRVTKRFNDVSLRVCTAHTQLYIHSVPNFPFQKQGGDGRCSNGDGRYRCDSFVDVNDQKSHGHLEIR